MADVRTKPEFAELFGIDIKNKFDKSLVDSGLGDEFRIDALSTEPRTFIELKICKLDKILGTRGGKCLYDIGPWAKDLNRLAILHRLLPNSRCYFILVALHKDKRLSKPETDFLGKIKTEFENDLKRGNDSELNENTIMRKSQKSILKKLISMKRSNIIAINDWEHISAIGIDIDGIK